MEITKIQTRQELTRSVDDAEKYKALRTLAQVGLLTPLSEIETFHGRVRYKNKDDIWQVDPAFVNHGNTTNNLNINQRSTLYTSERDVAESFARARKQEMSWKNDPDELQEEVHRIVSADPDASIINFSFDYSKLSPEDKQRYLAALRTLAISISKGSPVDFSERDSIISLQNVIDQLQKPLIISEDVAEIANLAGISEKVALQLTSGHNAHQLMQTNPAYLVHNLLEQRADIYVENKIPVIDGEKKDLPINLEYVQRYLRTAHIVGAEGSVDSDTLNKKIRSVYFFDLSKIGTQEQIVKKQEEIKQLLGGLIDKLPKIPKDRNEDGQALFEVLEDLHAKPEKIIEAAKKVKGYDEIFNMDAGNWEGFTTGEHTETVLRNFDENFADQIPAEYLYIMRLAILVHDIGKPIAAAKGEKRKQKEYNLAQAEHFLTQIGVDEKSKKLLTAIIGDGVDLIFPIRMNRNNPKPNEDMHNLATNTLKEYLGSDDVTEQQINAFIAMCDMLQTCDGGAYTSIAVTRREGKGWFRNAPSYNESFAPPIQPGKRDIQYRNHNQPPAPKSLTPTINKS